MSQVVVSDRKRERRIHCYGGLIDTEAKNKEIEIMMSEYMNIWSDPLSVKLTSFCRSHDRQNSAIHYFHNLKP